MSRIMRKISDNTLIIVILTNSVSGMGYFIFELLTSDPKTPKHFLASANILGDPPETDSKILLLKTSHMSSVRTEISKLVPTERLHPYWLTPIVLEDAMHTTRGERNHQPCPALATLFSQEPMTRKSLLLLPY